MITFSRTRPAAEAVGKCHPSRFRASVRTQRAPSNAQMITFQTYTKPPESDLSIVQWKQPPFLVDIHDVRSLRRRTKSRGPSPFAAPLWRPILLTHASYATPTSVHTRRVNSPTSVRL